jgi:hypothetical protein
MRNGAAHFLYRRRTAPIGDKGTILNIVSWILLAVVGCTLVARFAMKLSMKTKRRRLGLDDLFIGLATVSWQPTVLGQTFENAILTSAAL